MELCGIGLLAAAVIGYMILRYIWELFLVGDLASKAVFISGCDSGFGRVLSMRCARQGLTVFAGCFTEQGQKSLKEECDVPNLFTCPLDVSKDKSVEEARKYVEKNMPEGVKLWGVVNNAGIFSCYGPDDWCKMDDYINAMEINAFGVIRVTQAFKKMIKETRGRIVTVTSVNGRISTPGAGPYVTSKFAAEAYMDAIRQELYNWGIKCCTLNPGLFQTPLIDDSAMLKRIDKVWSCLDEDTKEEYGEEFKDYFGKFWNQTYRSLSSPNINLVIDAYYHALTARFPRARYFCGYDSIFFYIPLSLTPAWFSDLVIRYVGKQEVLPAFAKKEKAI